MSGTAAQCAQAPHDRYQPEIPARAASVRSGGTESAIAITISPTIHPSAASPWIQRTAIVTQSRSLMEVSSRVGRTTGVFVCAGGAAVNATGTASLASAVTTFGPVTSNSAFQSPGITNVYG